MRAQITTRFAALATLVGALACAGNTAKTDTDQAAAARDSTSARDTLNGDNQNPSGYRGMERDTSMVPPTQQTPTDTFLQRQGTGAAQDTAGYSGMERVDTTGQGQNQQGQNQGQTQTDTSGMSADTSSMSPSTNQSNPSSAGQSDSSYNQNNPSSTGQSDSTSQSNPSSSNESGTSSSNQSGATSLDSTGMSKTGDTTGYGGSQQGQDSTSHQ
jgi:trimeric autotransporter adhesin